MNKQAPELLENRRILEKTYSWVVAFNGYGETAKEKVKSFVTEWNASNPRGFRENKDSIFYPDFQYKISVYENGKEIEFRTFNYLINDSTNWVYTLEDKKIDYCHYRYSLKLQKLILP